jgi:hypothetical protein
LAATLIWLIILLLVFILLSKHILGPIAVRSRVSRPVDAGFEEIPDERARALFPANFFQTISELEMIGFTLIGHLSSAHTELTRATFSLLVNRTSKSSALVSNVAIVTPGTTRSPVNYLEFITEFDDGSQIDTSNSSSVKVFYEVPQRLAVKVPHLKDVNSLYRVHSYLVGQRARQAILPTPGSEKEHMCASIRKSLAQHAELGYFFLDEKTQRYRHTWRGAIRSTWRLLWPAKQIIQRRQERQGRQIATQAAHAG